ncbi:MAG TPA: nucleotide exchange factor GrpE [Stellaceae bacterium]|nr:nucleotide exchange factor GrpE [Stellaceae bacterium]
MAEDTQEPIPAKPSDRDATARLEAEVAELKDQLLRALADRENELRRAARDRDEAVRFAASKVVQDLLPVADSIRRAIESVRLEGAEEHLMRNLLAGIEVTERILLDAFDRHGIRRLEPAPGEKFDPNRHHAMAGVDTADSPAGTVVQVLQPGYVYHERLLRPALVSVAKAMEEPQAE